MQEAQASLIIQVPNKRFRNAALTTWLREYLDTLNLYEKIYTD